MTIGSLANGEAIRAVRNGYGEITAGKKGGTESVLRAVTVSKHDSYCQPTVIVISCDRPTHTLHKRPGDRQPQSC